MTNFPPIRKISVYEDVETTASDSATQLPVGSNKSSTLLPEYRGINAQISEDPYEHVAKQIESEAHLTYAQVRMSTLAEIEKDYILDVLKVVDGNKTKAAKILGITIKTLYNKLHEYGLMPKKEVEERPMLRSHYKCIRAFSDGYNNDFRVGYFYIVLDKKDGYVLVKNNLRTKPRWLSASRFEGV